MKKILAAIILSAALLLALVLGGCRDDAGAPAAPFDELIVGYWGVTRVISDGVETYRGPANEAYWVIYRNQTVCVIEKLPTGEYERDSSFVYELDGDRFVLRFDLDPLPDDPVTMIVTFAPGGDRLVLGAAATADRPALELTFARMRSIPDCGCAIIP